MRIKETETEKVKSASLERESQTRRWRVSPSNTGGREALTRVTVSRVLLASSQVEKQDSAPGPPRAAWPPTRYPREHDWTLAHMVLKPDWKGIHSIAQTRTGERWGSARQWLHQPWLPRKRLPSWSPSIEVTFSFSVVSTMTESSSRSSLVV